MALEMNTQRNVHLPTKSLTWPELSKYVVKFVCHLPYQR